MVLSRASSAIALLFAKNLPVATVISASLALTACGAREEGFSSLRDYEGTSELRGTLHEGRLYAISDIAIENVKMSLNYKDLTVRETTRQGSDQPAWSSSPVSLADRDLVIFTAKKSSDDSLVALHTRVVGNGDGQRLQDISGRTPRYLRSPGGTFEITYHYDRLTIRSPEATRVRAAIDGKAISINRASNSDAYVSEVVQAAAQDLIVEVTRGQAVEIWTLNIADETTLSVASEQATEFPALPNVRNNQVDADAFLAAFNAYRTRLGLPAVRFSVTLSEDAAENNRHQASRGLGHHYMGRASAQNSAAGYGTIQAVMNGWHNSSGHRVNMQNARWRCMGIHRRGNYWTQNFSSWADCR